MAVVDAGAPDGSGGRPVRQDISGRGTRRSNRAGSRFRVATIGRDVATATGRRDLHRVLPATVSSDTRERCVVGQGIYRMDERNEIDSFVRGALPAAFAGRSWLL